jgi:hypothetical protein
VAKRMSTTDSAPSMPRWSREMLCSGLHRIQWLFLAFAFPFRIRRYFGESTSAQICGLVCNAKRCIPHRPVRSGW